MHSIPFVPGQYVHIGVLPDLFIVIAFDDPAYRLRSQFGAEIKADRKTVRSASDRTQPVRNADSQEDKANGR